MMKSEIKYIIRLRNDLSIRAEFLRRRQSFRLSSGHKHIVVEESKLKGFGTLSM